MVAFLLVGHAPQRIDDWLYGRDVFQSESVESGAKVFRRGLGYANWDRFDPPWVRRRGSPICVGAAYRTRPWSVERGLAVCLERRVHLANGAYPDRV